MNSNYQFHVSKTYQEVADRVHYGSSIYLLVFNFVDWTERLLQDELQQGRNHLPVNISEIGIQ